MSTAVIRWAVAAVVCGLSVGIQAQTDTDVRPTFRSSADLVTIQASVRNSKGRPIKGLRPADFEVRDNGAGIQPEFLGQVFDPLVQDNRTLHQTRGGLGLGLAVVKGIVELHGGVVSAASEGPGCGAVFTIQLPLAP